MIAALRQSGLVVHSIFEESRGASDVSVAQFAKARGAILLTQDKDFSAIVQGAFPSAPDGVVLLRLAGLDTAGRTARVLAFLGEGVELAGFLTVLEPSTYRQRPIPPASNRE
jgi:predicted nuclease of predicted toxin-antitoxin system